MERYYRKIISFDAAQALSRVGYFRPYDDPGCMYFPNGHLTTAIVHPGYYAATVGETIDWFITKGIYIDISLETMAEPSWSWTVTFMGAKWKKIHDNNKGSVMGTLDGSVKSFDECANSAIIAAADMLDKYVKSIDKPVASEFARKLFDHEICRYARGSVVYGTFEEGVSDRDWLVVVDDSCQDNLAEYPKHTYQESVGEDDYQFITENDFIEMVKNSNIEALECVFSKPDVNDWKYLKLVKQYLDNWKLRQSVSAICSNSWVKCKKKLTVEKDYNLRVAQKSLWHSMRLYLFGIQIASTGGIHDFSAANWMWDEIKNSVNTSWEFYKEKYQPVFNELRSTLVKLCDRPKEETK